MASTRRELGGGVDDFLDRVQMRMEHMIGEIQSLRRRIAATDKDNEAQMYDIRLALEQLLVHLGGPTGQPSGVIDQSGQEVPLFSGLVADGPQQFAPPRGPMSSGPVPGAAPTEPTSPRPTRTPANGFPVGGFAAPDEPMHASGLGPPKNGPVAAPPPPPQFPPSMPPPQAAPSTTAAPNPRKFVPPQGVPAAQMSPPRA